jgi:hypothetical protein
VNWLHTTDGVYLNLSSGSRLWAASINETEYKVYYADAVGKLELATFNDPTDAGDLVEEIINHFPNLQIYSLELSELMQRQALPRSPVSRMKAIDNDG